MKKEHKKILTFLKKCDLTVISTADPENPDLESALIAFAENEKLEIFFQTNKYTRKAQNLQKNPHVAFVFGLTLHHRGTVQYQGVAEQIIKEEEVEACKQRFCVRKSPTAEPKYLNHPDAIYFKVLPRWIGFLDESPPKTTVTECRFRPYEDRAQLCI